MADAVLRQAPERFVLFGFSMGGFVAQAIALKAPERVLGLGLLNTSSRPQTERESQGRWRRSSWPSARPSRD
jgi:pimeloyl-ACP methyl ester carboxylesterase